MQISSVKISELNHEVRIDADYYRAEILHRLDILEHKNNNTLDGLVDFVVGPFGSTVTVDKYVGKSDFKYIRNRDIGDFRISGSAPALIPKKVWLSLPQFHIQENDLLITVVGTLGKVAIATAKDRRSIFSCKSTILRTTSINAFYLLVYLNSDTGNLFSLRGKRGAIQEGLNLTDLKEIQVFVPSNTFQASIEKIVRCSFTHVEQSESKLDEAETLLLSELELTTWKPKHRLAFVKNYSDTRKADRFDANYFQPKYEEIVKAVEKCKGRSDNLGNLVNVKKGIEPGREAYQASGIPFVRVSNLSKFEFSTDNQQFVSEELYKELKSHQPKKGEILLSKDATPGTAYFLNEEPQKMIVSGGILRLKIDDKHVMPEYLTLVLNSVIVQKQIERDAGGSIINHWRPDQVKATLIPILKGEKQEEIGKLVKKSFSDRKLSRSLLEIAKRGVEMAIEKNEKAAIKWLEKESEMILG